MTVILIAARHWIFMSLEGGLTLLANRRIVGLMKTVATGYDRLVGDNNNDSKEICHE